MDLTFERLGDILIEYNRSHELTQMHLLMNPDRPDIARLVFLAADRQGNYHIGLVADLTLGVLGMIARKMEAEIAKNDWPDGKLDEDLGAFVGPAVEGEAFDAVAWDIVTRFALNLTDPEVA
jgi:hypothetical protein